MRTLFATMILLLLVGCGPSTSPEVPHEWGFTMWLPPAGPIAVLHEDKQVLKNQAAEALKLPKLSVIGKAILPPSGDDHDYMSTALYAWPNPDSPDGLPWMTIDGKVNPLARSPESNKGKLFTMSQAVKTLGLACHYFKSPDYAVKAAELARAWFVSPATRMNPHLQYAQAIPGKVDGSRFGIIDSFLVIWVLDGLELIRETDAWTDADEKAMRQWIIDYLHWLETSEFGKAEGASANNHGTWYDLQRLAFCLYLEDPARAQTVVESVRQRIRTHIQPDGSQPEEMKRNRSFHYHTYNLTGLFMAAGMARRVDVDLFRQEAKRLRTALDYVAPYADPNQKWPHPEKQVTREALIPLLRMGGLVFGDARYEALLQEHFSAEKQRAIRLELEFPRPRMIAD